MTSRSVITGTPRAQWRCIYYPKYCSNLGHKDARSKECGMKTMSKAERDAAKKCILADAVEQEMRDNPQTSTYRWQKHLYFFPIILMYTNRNIFSKLFPLQTKLVRIRGLLIYDVGMFRRVVVNKTKIRKHGEVESGIPSIRVDENLKIK